MAFHYSPNVTKNGLIFYMDPANTLCYSGTGLTFSNLTSLTNGSITASASYNTITKSFDTNATTITYQSHINIPNITFPDASEYTLDYWVKLRNGTNSSNGLSGNGGTTQWLLLSVTSTTNWFVRYRENSGTYNDFTPITNINLERWTNITLVIKSSRSMDLYVNGYLSSSILTIPTSTLFNISRLAGGYSSGSNYYSLQGSISATKIYNRALSATEVERNFLSLKSRFGL